MAAMAKLVACMALVGAASAHLHVRAPRVRRSGVLPTWLAEPAAAQSAAAQPAADGTQTTWAQLAFAQCTLNKGPMGLEGLKVGRGVGFWASDVPVVFSECANGAMTVSWGTAAAQRATVVFPAAGAALAAPADWRCEERHAGAAQADDKAYPAAYGGFASDDESVRCKSGYSSHAGCVCIKVDVTGTSACWSGQAVAALHCAARVRRVRCLRRASETLCPRFLALLFDHRPRRPSAAFSAPRHHWLVFSNWQRPSYEQEKEGIRGQV